MKGNKIGFILICLLIFLVAILGLFNTLKKDDVNVNSNETYENSSLEKNYLTNIQDTNIFPVTSELASFSTTIYDTSKNRVNNIELACKSLNGYVLKPNEIFSFNNIIGPYSEDKGYLQSYGLDNEGKRIEVIGGGICQVSSTLYNVALKLNCEILERHKHSAPVGYIEEGKDATISYGRLDLKFKNTSNYDIKFNATCENNTVTITATTENMLPQS